MSLTGPITAALAVLLCVLMPILTLVLWNRFGRGDSSWAAVRRWIGRGGFLLGSQLTAVLLIAVLGNDANHFYTSWLELIGDHHTVSHPTAAPGNQDHLLQPKLADAVAHDRGLIVPIKIAGTASGINGFTALVYLPAQYGQPGYADRTFPVVELIAGSPGTPTTWTQSLHVASVLDTEIAAGRTQPMIVVMPSQDVDGLRDTQCVNVVGGPKVELYLTTDVRATIRSAFRADMAPGAWSLMGYSSGGFCATNIAMRHPDLYRAGVSIAGYSSPAHDHQTGELFGHNTALRNENTPLWRAQHLPPPNVALLLMTSKDDPQTDRDARKLAAVAREPLAVTLIPLAHGGHNFEVWRADEPVAFAWLSAHLPPALAPAPVVDNVSPVIVTR
ncbi:MAG: esterase family protein [Actinomycetota bacterium]|nr:esterase family protein [Actinomycetota bacterium]